MTPSLEHTKVFAGEIRMSASNHSGESFRFQAEVDLAHESAARLIREAIHRLAIERERSLIHDIKSPFSPHHAPGGVPLLRQRSQSERHMPPTSLNSKTKKPSSLSKKDRRRNVFSLPSSFASNKKMPQLTEVDPNKFFT